jgi:molecular chaperone GrpE
VEKRNHEIHVKTDMLESEETSAPGEMGEKSTDEMLRGLQEALATKEAEAMENWDKFVRERANLENYRKRVQREKEELLKYGNESLIMEILPVIDNMERALAHASEEPHVAVIEGIRLTHAMLLSALKKFGVAAIETLPGPFLIRPFTRRCTRWKAWSSLPNTIVEELQKGYLINDRLLRAALVSVAVPPRDISDK